jgi:OmpA family protein
VGAVGRGRQFRAPFGDLYELVDRTRDEGSSPEHERIDPWFAMSIVEHSRDELADALDDEWPSGVSRPQDEDRVAMLLRELERGPEGRFELRRIVVARSQITTPPPAPMLSDLAGPPEPPPPGPPVPFEVRVVDELGDAVAGVELTWSQAGETGSATTDGSGVARFERPPGPSFASVRFTDLDALRESMRPRWDAAGRSPGQTPVESSDDVTVVFLRDELDGRGFSLVAKTPHDISVQPYVLLARLFGLVFETSKSFLLPEAIPSLRAMRRIYDANPDTKLLLVGHTDTTGEPSYNDPLSLERAEAMGAYLQDDVDAWLAWYEGSKPAEKRWGSREDGLMMTALLGEEVPAGVSTTLAYQQHHNRELGAGNAFGEELAEDGAIGPKTRRALVTDYQKQDDTTLPVDVELQAHGCGESFPLDESAEQLDPEPANAREDRTDRRVELFFFDRSLGVQPSPGGTVSAAGSQEYPEWRARARVVQSFAAGIQVPIFDWADALDTGMPKDLELVLRDDEAEMTIAWKAGSKAGARRRFVFGDLSGDLPCTLVARTGGEEVVLLDAQDITSAELPIRWERWLEDLVAIPGPANQDTALGATLGELGADADVDRPARLA